MFKKYFFPKEKISVRKSRAGFMSGARTIDIHIKNDQKNLFVSFSRESLNSWSFEVLESNGKFSVFLPTGPVKGCIDFETRKSADDFIKKIADVLSPNYLLKAIKIILVIYILLHIPYGDYSQQNASSVAAGAAPAPFTSLSDVGLGPNGSINEISSRQVGPSVANATGDGPVANVQSSDDVASEIKVDVNDPFGLRLGTK